MPTLADKLLTPDNRPKVAADAARVVDEEVAEKGGLSGIVIKATYGLVKAIKPGVIREVIDAMLDQFVQKLEPFYQDFLSSDGGRGGNGFPAFLAPKASEVANALLTITDERAGRSRNATMKKGYEKLRPTGQKHVETAVPRLSRAIEKYL